jgi:hypothetical protein
MVDRRVNVKITGDLEPPQRAIEKARQSAEALAETLAAKGAAPNDALVMLEAADRIRAGRSADEFFTTIADWIESHGRDLASGGHLRFCDSPGDTEQALTAARAFLGGQS